MIVGIGVDLAEVHRIRDALERPSTGERFRARVFTAGEQAYCERRRRKYESYAARIAVNRSALASPGENRNAPRSVLSQVLTISWATGPM